MDGIFSLPVLWASGDGDAHAGRLDVTDAGLELDGGTREGRQGRTIAFADVESTHVARVQAQRIRGRRTLILELRDGSRVSIAPYGHPGSLHELAERLERGS